MVGPVDVARALAAALLSLAAATQLLLSDARAEQRQSDLVELQKSLKACGYYDGRIDDIWGPQTAKALRVYTERETHPSGCALDHDIVDEFKPRLTKQASRGRAAEKPKSELEARIRWERAKLAHEDNSYAEALSEFKAVMAFYGPLPELQYNAAQAAFEVGDFDKAEQYVLGALKRAGPDFKNTEEYEEALRLAAEIPRARAKAEERARQARAARAKAQERERAARERRTRERCERKCRNLIKQCVADQKKAEREEEKRCLEKEPAAEESCRAEYSRCARRADAQRRRLNRIERSGFDFGVGTDFDDIYTDYKIEMRACRQHWNYCKKRVRRVRDTCKSLNTSTKYLGGHSYDLGDEGQVRPYCEHWADKLQESADWGGACSCR